MITFLLVTFLFWFLYATVMRIRDKVQADPNGNKLLKIVGYAFLLIGYPYDVIYNYTYGSVVFWQFPRRGEYTFTARLKRTITLNTWRGDIARFICRYLVEPWDAGHCGQKLS